MTKFPAGEARRWRRSSEVLRPDGGRIWRMVTRDGVIGWQAVTVEGDPLRQLTYDPPAYFHRGDEVLHTVGWLYFLEPRPGSPWVARMGSLHCGATASSDGDAPVTFSIAEAARRRFCTECHPQDSPLGALRATWRISSDSELTEVEAAGRPVTIVAGEAVLTSLSLGVDYRVEVAVVDGVPTTTAVTVRSLDGRTFPRAAHRHAAFACDVALGMLTYSGAGGLQSNMAVTPGEAARLQRARGGPRSRDEWLAERRDAQRDKFARALHLVEVEKVPQRVAAQRMGCTYGTFRNILRQARQARG